MLNESVMIRFFLQHVSVNSRQLTGVTLRRQIRKFYIFKFHRNLKWGPLRDFGEQGNKAIYFREQGNKSLKLKRTGNKCNFGEEGHRKSRLWFGGTRENAIFLGAQGNRYPLPAWEGLKHNINDYSLSHYKSLTLPQNCDENDRNTPKLRFVRLM